MSKNNNLNAAKSAKNDEFYTQLTDIEKELRHYKEQFEGKTVFLNCDDPEESNFWKFFSLQFDNYKLKRLIATHYDSTKPTYMLEKIRKEDGTVEQNKKTLTQNGDFRSPECVKLLDECDIVVTNPPFSLFREYITMLIEHGKKFLVIGNMNAVTCKDIFPLIKEGKMWVGVNEKGGSRKGNSMGFVTPSGEIKEVSAWWFTNMDFAKRHEKFILWKEYIPEAFPKYDNYNAIHVDHVANIPCNYDGVMGVPINFLKDYCPEQFEILGSEAQVVPKEDLIGGRLTLNNKRQFPRILIRRKANT